MTEDELDGLKIILDQTVRLLRAHGEEYAVHRVLHEPDREPEPRLDVTAHLTDRLHAARREAEKRGVLSERETEVLRLVAGGLTTPQIARLLKVSPETVRTHAKRIRTKLGAKTRAEAVALAHLQDREPNEAVPQQP